MKTVRFTPIDEALIERVRDRILAACRPEAIYLFGSGARGDARAGSDLDLLVVMDLPEGVRSHEKTAELYGLFQGWKVPLDLIIRTPAQFDREQRLPGFIARTARREGILLYSQDDPSEVPMPDPEPEAAARAWFNKGDSDLRVAHVALGLDPAEVDAVCFHSQQAAEKYLKGFMAHEGEDPPRTHDLVELLDLIAAHGASFEALRTSARVLTPYAVLVRYPTLENPPDAQAAAEAVQHAERICRAVRARTAEDE